MKKQTQREKVVMVQEKMLESVKGGETTRHAGDPDGPTGDLSGGGG